jgi:hypothetical protein
MFKRCGILRKSLNSQQNPLRNQRLSVLERVRRDLCFSVVMVCVRYGCARAINSSLITVQL